MILYKMFKIRIIFIDFASIYMNEVISCFRNISEKSSVLFGLHHFSMKHQLSLKDTDKCLKRENSFNFMSTCHTNVFLKRKWKRKWFFSLLLILEISFLLSIMCWIGGFIIPPFFWEILCRLCTIYFKRALKAMEFQLNS